MSASLDFLSNDNRINIIVRRQEDDCDEEIGNNKSGVKDYDDRYKSWKETTGIQ